MRRAMMVALLGFALVSPAVVAASEPEPVCLKPYDIKSYEVVDGQTLKVKAVGGNSYLLHLIGACPALKRMFSAGIKTASRLSCVRPGDVVIVSAYPQANERCAIGGVELYVPDEAQAETPEAN